MKTIYLIFLLSLPNLLVVATPQDQELPKENNKPCISRTLHPKFSSLEAQLAQKYPEFFIGFSPDQAVAAQAMRQSGAPSHMIPRAFIEYNQRVYKGYTGNALPNHLQKEGIFLYFAHALAHHSTRSPAETALIQSFNPYSFSKYLAHMNFAETHPALSTPSDVLELCSELQKEYSSLKLLDIKDPTSFSRYTNIAFSVIRYIDKTSSFYDAVVLPTNGGELGLATLTSAVLQDIALIGISGGPVKAHNTLLTPLGFAFHDKAHGDAMHGSTKTLSKFLLQTLEKHAGKGSPAHILLPMIQETMGEMYQQTADPFRQLYQILTQHVLPTEGSDAYRRLVTPLFFALHELNALHDNAYFGYSTPTMIISNSLNRGRAFFEGITQDTTSELKTSFVTGETPLSDKEIIKKFSGEIQDELSRGFVRFSDIVDQADDPYADLMAALKKNNIKIAVKRTPNSINIEMRDTLGNMYLIEKGTKKIAFDLLIVDQIKLLNYATGGTLSIPKLTGHYQEDLKRVRQTALELKKGWDKLFDELEARATVYLGGAYTEAFKAEHDANVWLIGNAARKAKKAWDAQ